MNRASSAPSACPGFIMAAVGFLKTNPNPDAGRTGARHVGQPVPLPGLRQDPDRDDARRGEHEEGEPCLRTLINLRNHRACVRSRTQTDRQELPNSRSVCESHGTGKIRRGLSRRRHAVLQTPAEPFAARARKASRRKRGACHARRESDSHGGRSSGAGRQPHRQWHSD